MAVIAKFIYEVKPGRMPDFMAKLAQAGHARFTSPVMPKSFRLFRSTLPGPDTGHVVMLIEYEDMAATWLRWVDGDGNLLLTGKERAEQAVLRAEQEHLRAEQERTRSEQAYQRVERLTAMLRELGVDPDAS